MTSFFFDASALEPAERLNKEEGEIVGIDNQDMRLLLSVPKADISDDELILKRSLVSRFPKMQLHSLLRDSHLYLFKAWVLDLIVKVIL